MAENEGRVEVDLGLLYLGESDAVADVILGKAAERLLARLPRDLRHELTARAKSVAEEELRVLLRPALEAALGEAIQPTNRLGEPRGEPKTLRELIVAMALEALKQTKETGSSFARRRTLVEEIVHTEIEVALRNELKPVVEAEAEKLRLAVREKGAEILAEVARRLHA